MDQINWATQITTFSKVILEYIEKNLVQQGYSSFEFLQSGVQGEIIKAFSEKDQRLVQIFLQHKNKNEYQSIKDEYDTLVNLKDCKYIVKYLRVLYFEEIFICAIVSDYFSLSLQDELQLLRQSGSWLNDEQIVILTLNLCYILQELHLNNLSHFNLDPSKIVKSDEGIYKINDLSLSIALKSDRHTAISFIKSNSKYSSPELEKLVENNSIALTQKSDVFSMSLIIFEVLGYPVDDITIKQIQNGHFFKEKMIDGFRFKDLQKLLIECFYHPQVDKRVESYQMVYKLLPLLPFSQKVFEMIYEELQTIIDEDPYSYPNNIPYIQNLRVHSQLAQIVILKVLPKTTAETITQAEEKASDLLYKISDQKKSLQMRLEILSFYKQNQPSNIIKISELNLKISQCYIKQLDYKNGLLYSEIAFLQSVQIYKGASIQTSQCLYILSWSYFGLNEPQKAVEFGLKSLEMKRKVYPENDLNIATSLNAVGSMYDKLNQIELGLQYKLEALDIRQYQVNQGNKEVLPHLIFSYLTLGSTYTLLKQYQVSLDYNTKALELRKSMFGYYHQEVVDCLTKIKNVYRYMKNRSEANRIDLEIKSIQNNIQFQKVY